MANDADTAVELQVRQACTDLERRLRAGQPCRTEDYLATSPQLAKQMEGAFDLIYAEYLTRVDLNQQALAHDFYARFPQWREYLEQQFAFHQRLVESLPALPTDSTPRPASNRAPPRQGHWPKHYEMLEELGRGGMGVVHKARQVGLNRTVALKMIARGEFAGDDELARFRAEAETAARLQHPNIVQIYEVGEHDGQPFIAFEYVAGGNLAELASNMPQQPSSAATLVATVARAMHYAHQQGVVHRDLKPANILVGKDEGERMKDETKMEPAARSAFSLQPSTLKITDFGLAKRLDRDDQLTRSGMAVGTPSYMAPELAAGNVRATSPLVDVYSLGGILYQLLTGRPPFQGTTTLETLHQARWAEPIPPRLLQPSVPRDLEVICLKSLEKEPAKRYASAQALADDLQRFLDGEPIAARAVGRAERAWRWCRRNPVVASLGALVVLAFLLGFAGIAWKWGDAEYQKGLVVEEQRVTAKERDAAVAAQTKAEAAEKTARKEAATSAAVLRYLVDELLLAAAPDSRHVRQLTVAEVLRSAIKNIDKELKDQPAVEATVRFAVGESLLRLGNYADAKTQLERARELCLALYGEEHKDTLLVFNDLANLAQERGDLAEAEALYKKTLAIQHRMLGERSQEALRTMHNLASLLHEKAKLSEPYDDNKLAEAEDLYRKTLQIRREELTAEHPSTLNTANLLALVLKDRGQRYAAEKLMQENLQIRRRVLPAGHPDIASSWLALGKLLFDNREFVEAERHFREAVEIFNGPSGLPADHWRTANAESLLGGSLTALKRYEDAETLLVKAHEKLTSGKGAPPATIRSAWQRIVELYAAWGKSEKAAEWRAKQPPAVIDARRP